VARPVINSSLFGRLVVFLLGLIAQNPLQETNLAEEALIWILCLGITQDQVQELLPSPLVLGRLIVSPLHSVGQSVVVQTLPLAGHLMLPSLLASVFPQVGLVEEVLVVEQVVD
jgi:hypothetical protein